MPTRCWPAGVLAPLLLSNLVAAAQPATPTAYRCADGRYTDRPCPGGKALAVDDARTPEQQAQAQEAARRERELAGQLRKQNDDAEAQARRRAAPVAGIGKPPAQAASAPSKSASHAHHGPGKKHQRADSKSKHGKPPGDRQSTDGRLGQY